MQIRSTTFDFSGDKAYIMGILNLTPDSFSDGGQYTQITQALKQVECMCREGADMIDIGAESTRPGHVQISTAEEIQRLIPMLTHIRRTFPDMPLSIDCYRSATAKAALDAGADMINDIWGLTYDADMAPLIAKHQCPVCIMHNRTNRAYQHFLPDVLTDLQNMLSIAAAAGIPKEKIILDPGVGFPKNEQENLLIIQNLAAFKHLGLPLLLGTSRKGFLGHILGVPAAERDIGTATTSVYGYLQGARIFRVHNVAANRQALDTLLAIERASHGSY